jgi:hypothetical protein
LLLVLPSSSTLLLLLFFPSPSYGSIFGSFVANLQPLVRLFRCMVRFYPALIFICSVVAPSPRRPLSPPSSLPSPSLWLLVLSRFSDRIFFNLLSDGSSLQHAHSQISSAGRSYLRHLHATLFHLALRRSR